MRIAAIADVHSPRYLDEFKEALSNCERPDLFLLAGDMIEFGKVWEYRNVADVITTRFDEDVPIVACFGNDEGELTSQEATDIVDNRIEFLDSSSEVVSHDGQDIGILGVPIVTVNNDMSIEEIFESKISILAEHLGVLSKSCDKSILLMHYSPLSTETFPEAFSWWISKTIKNNLT